MGYSVVLPSCMCIFATSAITSFALFTIYTAVLSWPVLQATFDTYNASVAPFSIAMDSSGWISGFDSYTDIAISAISTLIAVISQVGHNVLDVLRSSLIQLTHYLVLSTKLCSSLTMVQPYEVFARILSRFRTDSATLSTTISIFLWGNVTLYSILLASYSFYVLSSFVATLDDNDLHFITTLNSYITQAVRKTRPTLKRLQQCLPHASATISGLVVFWPTSILRAWCYSSRLETYLEDSLRRPRCDNHLFTEVYVRVARSLFAHIARAVSLALFTLLVFLPIAYGSVGLYTIWAAYLTRKKLASSKDSSGIRVSTALVARPPRTAHPSSILASTVCSRLPDDYYFLQDFVDQYEPGVQLGAGSFGVVLQARRRIDGREVAVKFVKKGPHSDYWEEHPIYGRVPREVNIMDLVRHENIISLLDVFSDHRYAYIVQELHGSLWFPMSEQDKETFPNGGHSLAAYICANGATPLEDARYIFYQLVDAIHSLHSNGITHCDIKPANILIDSNLKVKLIDFGSAIRRPSPEGGSWHGDPPKYYTDYRYFGGTTTYSPLEFFRSQRDGSRFEVPPADIWALGLILCQLLTGIQPFRTQYGLKNGLLEYDTTDSSQWEALLPMWGVVDSCLDRVPQLRPTTDFLRRRNEHTWGWRVILEKTRYRTSDMYIE